jgi:hypothetical protein
MTKQLGPLVLAVSLLGACGSDGFSTGLPPDKGLGTLTPAEATKLCSSTATFVQAKADAATCQFTALVAGVARGKTDAEARTICKTELDQCLARATGTGGGGPVNCPAPPASCTATVGEYEACLNDRASSYDKALASLPTCETVTRSSSSFPTTAPTVTTPASCTTAQRKCLGFSLSPGPSSGAGSGSGPPPKR